MSVEMIMLVAGVFALAGAVKGLSGMGLPTVAMALLSFVLAPASAAALMIIPSMATNVAQSIGPHAAGLARRLWPLWIGVVFATLFSPLPNLGAPGSQARVFLAGVLMVYGCWGLVRMAAGERELRSSRDRYDRLRGVAHGLLTGIVIAATAVAAISMVPYLQSLRLGRDELIQALGISFLLATIALALRLGSIGAVDWPGPLELLFATLAAFAGLWLGGRYRRRLGQAAFVRAIYLTFIVLGVAMLVRAF